MRTAIAVYRRNSTLQVSARGKRFGCAEISFWVIAALTKLRLCVRRGSGGKGLSKGCLSPIILSPLNGQVKMSPHEQGDILIESERVATSGGDFSMYQGRGGVCQSRRAALLERAPDQA